jgi:hypothetical protein
MPPTWASLRARFRESLRVLCSVTMRSVRSRPNQGCTGRRLLESPVSRRWPSSGRLDHGDSIELRRVQPRSFANKSLLAAWFYAAAAVSARRTAATCSKHRRRVTGAPAVHLGAPQSQLREIDGRLAVRDSRHGARARKPPMRSTASLRISSPRIAVRCFAMEATRRRSVPHALAAGHIESRTLLPMVAPVGGA